MRDTDCKCSQRQMVHYAWAGEDIPRESGESWARAIAEWFALRAANEEFAKGNLDSKRFDQFRCRLVAYVEQKINRVANGRLLPGSEVVCVALAKNEQLPIFELTWHNEERSLKRIKKLLIRQYEGEPHADKFEAFGLHMHLKDIRRQSEINSRQNDEIRSAMDIYRCREKNGWPNAE